VLHLEHLQVSARPGGFVVVTFFRSASAICLVISGGRSEVHASQARKFLGLCNVQTGHVHPLRSCSGDGGSGAATVAGLGASASAGAGVEEVA
jgi:hypothetical protein